MDAINISKNRFNNLELYRLPDHIFNTEAKLYILPEKSKWETKTKLLKKFYVTTGSNFGNKLQTINSLIDNRELIHIEELVFPEHIAIVNGQVVGYTMPLVKSINFASALNSINVSVEQKIAYFKAIGLILRKMDRVRNHTTLTDFYLNDIHENNFVIDTTTNQIKVVDLDSCKIANNVPFPSKYLSKYSPINGITKYKTEELDYGEKMFIPDKNTDLYCYNIMVLNYLYGDNISKLSLPEFYNYLDYLLYIGVSRDLLDALSKIYSYSDNVNIDYLLDGINGYIGKSNHFVYERIKKVK